MHSRLRCLAPRRGPLREVNARSGGPVFISWSRGSTSEACSSSLFIFGVDSAAVAHKIFFSVGIDLNGKDVMMVFWLSRAVLVSLALRAASAAIRASSAAAAAAAAAAVLLVVALVVGAVDMLDTVAVDTAKLSTWSCEGWDGARGRDGGFGGGAVDNASARCASHIFAGSSKSWSSAWRELTDTPI